MKHKVIIIIGVLLLVLGTAIILLQFTTGEKSVIGTIAAGATPIIMSALVLGQGLRMRRKALGNPSDTHH